MYIRMVITWVLSLYYSATIQRGHIRSDADEDGGQDFQAIGPAVHAADFSGGCPEIKACHAGPIVRPA